jgi:hypothetical protein
MRLRPLLIGFGLLAGSPAFACPNCHYEQCDPTGLICVCVPAIGDNCNNPLREIEKLGDATLTTLTDAGGDTIRTLENAGGDIVKTAEKAGGDTIQTFVKVGEDATATYVKAWKDTGEQAQRSFTDAVDAGNAIVNYTANQLKAQADAFQNAEKRLREGKIVDAMWGLGVEPLQATEANFAKATQESKVIAAAAASAAAVYGGPGGAAAYAAWSTYRSTGDADLALRAGLLAAVTAQAGGSGASMPSGTASELLKKAATAGAAGGIAVAAAGGDEQAITDGFLKSAGAVLIQAGSAKAQAYSPRAKDAWDTVHCISARDLDCVSNTTWARANGRILYDSKGRPRFNPIKLDPSDQVGKWSEYAKDSIEGKKNAFMTKISQLPKVAAIPLMKNQWVLTWTGTPEGSIAYGKPTVVLTYVGQNPPFTSMVNYGRANDFPDSASNGELNSEGGATDYSCTGGGINRTVKVRRLRAGCEAWYRRDDGGAQLIWHSDHFPEICTGKAVNFIKSLRAKGLSCRAR